MPPSTPVGLVVLFHGLGAHARFPTVQIAAELLSANGFIVCALDLPGHGASPELRGFIYSAESLMADGLAAYRAAVAACPKSLPTFLMGTSMGGAIAVMVAQLANEQPTDLPTPSGLVLLAPMLAPAPALLSVTEAGCQATQSKLNEKEGFKFYCSLGA